MKLYTIGVLVQFTAVIAAATEEAAMNHVKDWDTAWLNSANADCDGVIDGPNMIEVREPQSPNIRDDAHDAVTEPSGAAGKGK